MAAKKRAKIDENFTIRPELFEEGVKNSIQKIWKTVIGFEHPHIFSISKESHKANIISHNVDVEVVVNPFSVCLVRNLLPPEIIRNAVSQLDQVKFVEKSNDLYEFRQTEDVANLGHIPAIKELYNVICNDVFKWVEATFSPSGLKPQVAATFSCYSKGDRLLCHDDQCEDRHIAFVLYLTEDWKAEDGGSLDLFSADTQGNPDRVVMSLTSLFNTLVLFEVSSNSFHQVSEVLSKTKKRLSLNGWFHKANLPERPELPHFPFEVDEPVTTEFDLEEYMFNKYLTLRNQIDIKTIFVANSEIQLDEFFQPDVFQNIIDEFSSTDIAWKMIGPANVRHYEVIDVESLKEKHSTLESLLLCLQSRSWLRFLRNITGLDLVPATNSDLAAWQKGIKPACKIELQRWLPGSYTLVHDRDPEFYSSSLDVLVRVPVCEGDGQDAEGDAPQAGHVIYIDKDSQDEECLLHLGYKVNSLCLVFREPGTLRFTKYLHSDATPFYQIQCTYIPWAPPVDEPQLKHVDSDAETDSEENGMDSEGNEDSEGEALEFEVDTDDEAEEDPDRQTEENGGSETNGVASSSREQS